MSYEELLNEPTTALKTVVSAIGLSATPAALHKIQELTTASKLQSDHTINMRSVGNSPKPEDTVGRPEKLHPVRAQRLHHWLDGSLVATPCMGPGV